MSVLFGLNELRAVLGRVRKPDLETIQCILDIFKIENVAEQEAVNEAEAAAKAGVAASGNAAAAKVRDDDDKRQTAEEVAKLVSQRNVRAYQCKLVVEQQELIALRKQYEERRLLDLAKVAKKMTS